MKKICKKPFNYDLTDEEHHKYNGAPEEALFAGITIEQITEELASNCRIAKEIQYREDFLNQI